jgi:hypothetical protein
LAVHGFMITRERRSYEDVIATFLQSFNTSAASRETSRTRDKKDFTVGSVFDSKRPDRSASRRDHVGVPEASYSRSPQRSMRKHSSELAFQAQHCKE